MKWEDLLPRHIARQQLAWERKALAQRMRDCGLQYGEIARRLKVSRHTASTLVSRHQRDTKSPVQIWMSKSGDMAELADKLWDKSINDFYSYVAARLGITREQAKKEIYRRLYRP